MALTWRTVDYGKVFGNWERLINFWDGLLMERWYSDWRLCWAGLDVDCKALNGFDSIDSFNMTFEDETFLRQIKQVKFSLDVLRLSILGYETDLKISLWGSCQFSLWIWDFDNTLSMLILLISQRRIYEPEVIHINNCQILDSYLSVRQFIDLSGVDVHVIFHWLVFQQFSIYLFEN